MNDTRYTAIAALREEFPKANKGTVSMALHTQALERNGIASMQTFLETLVLAWLAQSESSTTWAEKGKSAAGGDDTDDALKRKNNHYPHDTTQEGGLSSVQNVPLP